MWWNQQSWVRGHPYYPHFLVLYEVIWVLSLCCFRISMTLEIVASSFSTQCHRNDSVDTDLVHVSHRWPLPGNPPSTTALHTCSPFPPSLSVSSVYPLCFRVFAAGLSLTLLRFFWCMVRLTKSLESSGYGAFLE